MTYYVWCDMPDFEGPDTNNFLEDYYQVMYSLNDGATWAQSHYDYATDNGEDPPGGDSYAGWVKRTTGLSGGSFIPLAVYSRTDATSPETLRVAFQITTDADDDGGAGGTGVHIDDVEFIATRAFDRDAATRNMVVPYPTTVGQLRSWTFVYANDGLLGLGQLRYRVRYFLPDGSSIPPAGDSTVQVLPGALNYGETTTGTKAFTPGMAGGWRLRVFAAQTVDQDRTNDTTYSPSNASQNDDSTLAVYVRPAGTYELGYGRRAVANAYLSPRYFHFTPAADGVPAADADTIDLTQLRVMWRYDAELADSGGRVRIDFWEEGVDTFHTGALINSITTEIDTGETIGLGGFVHWWEMDLSTVPGLSNRTGNFWVSLTQLDTFVIDGVPQVAPLPLGFSPPGVEPDGHTYFSDGSVLTQSGGRLLANVIIQPTQTSTPDAVNDLVIHRSGGSNDIELSWGAAPRANGYYVWRLTTPTQPYQNGTLLTTLPITATSYVDVGALNAGLKFFYVVIATN